MSIRVSRSRKAIADRRQHDVDLRDATLYPMDADWYRKIMPWQCQYAIRRWLTAYYAETFGALKSER